MVAPSFITARKLLDLVAAVRKGFRIASDTVLSELKKKEALLATVNTALLRTLNPEQVAVHIEQAGEAEVDEMWSFVGNKGNPRWLWHAIDHHTGAVLA